MEALPALQTGTEMIWKRLKKSTLEQEQEFRDNLEREEITFKDKLAMCLSAFLVIVLPCLAVLIVLALLVLWMFGAF